MTLTVPAPARPSARLALALLAAASLALGSGANGATAVEPPDRPTLRSIEAGIQMPLYNQPTMTLQPTAVKSVSVLRTDGRALHTRAAEPPAVGWIQYEGALLGSDSMWVSETAVKFDLAALDTSERTVTRAVLRFDERAGRWTSASGAAQYKEGCVARLGIATVDWADQPVNALFPNDNYSTAADGSARAWEVTRHLKRQLASPGNASLRHGYVLQGAMDLSDLRADDDTSCSSHISNIRLEVTLEAAERPAPKPAPAAKPAPPPKPAPPNKPDLAVTRVSGPAEVFDGVTAIYEVVLWSEGTPAKGTAQVQINAIGPIEPVEMVETPDGFACDLGEFGFSCTGSLGGVDDAIQTRGAIFKLQVRGNGSGSASVYGSANHDASLDEMTADNNLKLLEVTVK